MNFVVATTDKKLSHKFSKTEIFTFYNDQREVIGVYKNPALGVTGCSAKGRIIDLFKSMNAEVVIVRKIGEKTLGKLLNSGFKVEQGNTRDSIDQLLENAFLQKHSLLSADQGVPNKNSACGHH